VQQHIAGEVREFPDESTGEKKMKIGQNQPLLLTNVNRDFFYWRTRYIWAEGIPKPSVPSHNLV